MSVAPKSTDYEGQYQFHRLEALAYLETADSHDYGSDAANHMFDIASVHANLAQGAAIMHLESR